MTTEQHINFCHLVSNGLRDMAKKSLRKAVNGRLQRFFNCFISHHYHKTWPMWLLILFINFFQNRLSRFLNNIFYVLSWFYHCFFGTKWHFQGDVTLKQEQVAPEKKIHLPVSYTEEDINKFEFFAECFGGLRRL